jgi:hypothetical protein
VFGPKVEKIQTKFDFFDGNIIEMQECIRRFDEDLSFKVNKSGLTVFEQQCRLEFVKVTEWKSIRENLINEQEKMENVVERFQRTFTELETEIQTTIFS